MILQSKSASREYIQKTEQEFLKTYSKKTNKNNQCATMETATAQGDFLFPEGGQILHEDSRNTVKSSTSQL